MNAAADVKTLIIDGHHVSARAGQTILDRKSTRLNSSH